MARVRLGYSYDAKICVLVEARGNVRVFLRAKEFEATQNRIIAVVSDDPQDLHYAVAIHMGIEILSEAEACDLVEKRLGRLQNAMR